MKINSIKLYSPKTHLSHSAQSGVKIYFTGTEKKPMRKTNPFISGANKLKNYAGDKFLKTSGGLSAKNTIFHRFNHEFDEICREHQVTRAERDSLITKFDIFTLNKETKLVLDENKNLKNVFIRNTNDDTKSLKFDFDKEKLTGATYILNGKKIKLNVNSQDFEKTFLLSGDFDLNTGILIGDINSRKFRDGHILEHFDSINNVVYGKMPRNLRRAVEEYEKTYEGKKIYVDHNVEPSVIKSCIQILEHTPLNEIPESILVTNFLEDDTSGLYCQTEAIVIRPTKNRDILSRRLFHEIQHKKDYLTGKPLGQKNSGLALIFDNKILHDCDGQILEGKIEKEGEKIIFKDEKLIELIEDKVSNYAATNAGEYIADVGSMMRQGTIGVCPSMKSNNLLYSIKNNYKNEDLKDCTITEEEFKTLLRVYVLLGGTPEINNAIYCKDAVGLTHEEIFAPESDL